MINEKNQFLKADFELALALTVIPFLFQPWFWSCEINQLHSLAQVGSTRFALPEHLLGAAHPHFG